MKRFPSSKATKVLVTGNIKNIKKKKEPGGKDIFSSYLEVTPVLSIHFSSLGKASLATKAFGDMCLTLHWVLGTVILSLDIFLCCCFVFYIIDFIVSY